MTKKNKQSAKSSLKSNPEKKNLLLVKSRSQTKNYAAQSLTNKSLEKKSEKPKTTVSPQFAPKENVLPRTQPPAATPLTSNPFLNVPPPISSLNQEDFSTIKQQSRVVSQALEEEKQERRDLQGAIEALLFASGKPLSLDTIALLTGVRKSTAHKALEQLKESYQKKGGALVIFDEQDLWRISIKEKHLPVVRKIVADMELSKSILETLAIIAWKSPLMQAELVKVRSTKVYDHVPELERTGLVIKEKKGRSFQLRITQKFFDYFELDGAHHIKELFQDAQATQRIQEQEKKTQRALEQERAPEKLGALDVVDIASAPTTVEQADKIPSQTQQAQEHNPGNAEAGTPTLQSSEPPGEAERDVHEFLSDIDRKIEAIAKNHEGIELRRLAESGTESTQGGDALEQDQNQRSATERTHKEQKRAAPQGKKKILEDLQKLKAKPRKLSALRKR